MRMASLLLTGAFAGLLAAGCGTTSETYESVRGTVEEAIPASANAGPDVRVRIIYTLDQVDAWTAGGYEVRAASGTETVTDGSELLLRVDGSDVVLESGGNELARGAELTLQPDDWESLLHIAGVPFGIGWWWAGVEDRSYMGLVESRVNTEGMLDVVVTLPLEEYLRGVVPQEIGADSPLEALKAQAVAARSDTVVAMMTGKYQGDGYDICADVECQVYGGAGKHASGPDQAIAETRGLVLAHDGEPFAAYYASNCGGHSEDIENVWPQRSSGAIHWSGNFDADEGHAYDLRQEADIERWIDASPAVWCNPAEHDPFPQWAAQNFRWVREFTAEEMAGHAASREDIGRVLRIEPVERGVSGRMIRARFVGERGEFEAGPELNIRQVWDPPLRSAAFIVEMRPGADGVPEHFTIRGAGWGHGVGMCQTGAIVQAHQGRDFRTILQHYYRESEVIAAH